jgi:D-glycero-alpha-D-manno-heptose 1-phosphate guanylyltransferase
MRSDEAIVLAGGLGTRLRRVVGNVPKPLAPVAGRPFLAWVLDHLAQGGMRHVILATGYRGEMIERAVGREWGGMAVDYSVESEPLGTGGAVSLAREHLWGQTAHVLNGDTFLRYQPGALSAMVLKAAAAVGVALAHVPDVRRYGAVRLEGDHLREFSEKVGSGPGYVNAGCYFLDASTVAGLAGGVAYSLEVDVLRPLASQGAVVGFKNTTGFIDIGVPQDYARAQKVFG